MGTHATGLLEGGRQAMLNAIGDASAAVVGDDDVLDPAAARAFTVAVRDHARIGVRAHSVACEHFLKRVVSLLERTLQLEDGKLVAALEADLEAGKAETALGTALGAGDMELVRLLASFKTKLRAVWEKCATELENVDIDQTFLYRYLTGAVRVRLEGAGNFKPELDDAYTSMGWHPKVITRRIRIGSFSTSDDSPSSGVRAAAAAAPAVQVPGDQGRPGDDRPHDARDDGRRRRD